MFLALAGGAEPLDLPGAPVDDEVVLDAVALLLAAVELPLPLGILGALDGALHSIDDELESLAFAQPASPATSRRRGPPCPVHTSVSDADELAFQKLARALPEQFQILGFPRRGVSLRVCTFLRGRLLWSSSVYFDELASKHKHPRTCRLPYWLPSAKQLAPCKGYLNSTGKDCNGE